MTANKTTLAVLAATLCGGHQLVHSAEAVAAPAGAPTASRTATIEVVKKGPGKAKQTMAFTLALADERRPSRLKVSSDGTYYRISISHEKQKGKTAVVHLELRHDEHGRPATRVRRWRVSHQRRGSGRVQRPVRRRPSTSTDVSLSSRVTLGKRTLMGRLQPPGGGEMRIAVTLR